MLETQAIGTGNAFLWNWKMKIRKYGVDSNLTCFKTVRFIYDSKNCKTK